MVVETTGLVVVFDQHSEMVLLRDRNAANIRRVQALLVRISRRGCAPMRCRFSFPDCSEKPLRALSFTPNGLDLRHDPAMSMIVRDDVCAKTKGRKGLEHQTKHLWGSASGWLDGRRESKGIYSTSPSLVDRIL